MRIKPKTEWTTFGEMELGAIFYLDGSLYIKIKRDDGLSVATNKMRTFLTYLEDGDEVREVQTCKVGDLEFGDLWWYDTDLSHCYVKLEGDRSLRLGSAVDWEWENDKNKVVALLELADG